MKSPYLCLKNDDNTLNNLMLKVPELFVSKKDYIQIFFI